MSDKSQPGEVYEFPVSPTQASLWVLNQMMPENPAYNIPMAVRMTGEVQVDEIKKALELFIQRHEIFRTTYSEEKGELTQLVTDSIELNFCERSFDNNTELLDFLQNEIVTPFDLSNKVFRVGLLKESTKSSVFYVIVHHIAVDHGAMLTLANEFALSYNSFIKNQEPVLPEPELQYADYVIWNQERLAEMDASIEAWKQKLKNYSGLLALPSDKPRPPMPSGAGAEYRFKFSQEHSSKIIDFSRQNSSSLFHVLLSALYVLLARYSNENDIIVGTPFSNRQDGEGLDDVVGCFINTLPLAVSIQDDASFTDCINMVKKTMLFAFENQHVPFETIVNTCVEHRDLSYNPLFQVGFVFQEPPATFSLDGIECSAENVFTGGAMYDLHLWLWEDNKEIQGVIWYNTDIHLESSIKRLLGNYETLVKGLIRSPEQSVFEVPLVSDVDQIINKKINETQVDLLKEPLPILISKQAQIYPSVIAAHFSNGESLTYEELDKRSNVLANTLVERGVTNRDFIGICVERTEQMLIGLLAIMKTGAAYVPLDPEYPEDRLMYMVEKSNIQLLLVTEGVSKSLPAFTGEKLILNGDTTGINEAKTSFVSKVTPEDLAYVIFTSGSTGQPKGVQIPHRAVSNFLGSMAIKPGYTKENTLLAVTTLSFDIAVLELYLPLISGGSIVVADSRQAAVGSALFKLIKEHQIDVMQATPSTWRGLLAAGFEGGDSFKALCGGEAFPEDLATDLVSKCGSVWNMYGPTETTVWSTCFQLDPTQGQIYIGSPIANTQCYVLDSKLNQVPVGVPSELFIGGDGVACGYLGQEDLTKDRFLNNPYGEGKIYRTGDAVRILEDGNLEYFNRVDNQVKVRGFRIELGEIESILSEMDSVVQAVVHVKEFSAIDQRLVAYVKFKQGEKLTNTDVRRHLQTFLPNYMLPQLLVEIEEFPLTPNGKIDRKSLPNPFTSIGQERPYHAPETDIQKRIASIWSEKLKIDKISLTDNFFDIGGHSLLSMLIIHQLENEYNLKLSPADMIANTLEKLAELIESKVFSQQSADAKNSSMQAATEEGLVEKPKAKGFFRHLLRKK